MTVGSSNAVETAEDISDTQSDTITPYWHTTFFSSSPAPASLLVAGFTVYVYDKDSPLSPDYMGSCSYHLTLSDRAFFGSPVTMTCHPSQLTMNSGITITFRIIPHQ